MHGLNQTISNIDISEALTTRNEWIQTLLSKSVTEMTTDLKEEIKKALRSSEDSLFEKRKAELLESKYQHAKTRCESLEKKLKERKSSNSITKIA